MGNEQLSKQIVRGGGLSIDDIRTLKTSNDEDLTDLIHELRWDQTSDVMNAKRDYVIALLAARGQKAMLNLTWWITILTWVLVGFGTIQVIDVIVRCLK